MKSGDFEMEVDAIEGQFIGGGMNEAVTGNQLKVSEETILDNMKAIQESNEVEVSKEFNGLNFTVEMETGTGKTYVYLRTIHEMYQQYGFKKFIIVVPSIAIKEGVLKNLQITKEHFDTLYEHPEMDYAVYDSKKRGQLKQFATNNTLQILVINIDSFAKFSKSKKGQNIIYQQSDWGVPMEYIQGVSPIVIIDEPQNMETDIRKQAIQNLNPLFTLRYSATHKNLYNLVYKLDPVKAYDLGLVKRIEVDSVMTEDSYNQAYLQLEKVVSKGKKVTAKLVIDKSDDYGLQKKAVTVKVGDDLYEKSGKREVYKNGFIINEIDTLGESVTLSSGDVIYVGQNTGDMTDEIMKFQMRKTLLNHFEKEMKYAEQGIKVLSLFFIDKVANYREYHESGVSKGKFALWFEEIYQELKANPKFAEHMSHEADQVHNGYFSQDKKGVLKDTNGNTKADDQTYELIMKDKERLLSLDEPLRFIFSHSALREGWDNPNVFQICTLNETKSEIKKRQEIGRGMRLPVNQEGVRVKDENINILTVTANESYEDFAKSLQTEMEQDCGVNFSGRVKDKAKRKKLQVRKGFQLDENFKDLWSKINHKTQYHVQYDTEELIEKASAEISDLAITAPKLVTQKASLQMSEKGVEGALKSFSEKRLVVQMPNIPDVIGGIQKNTKLTKSTLLEIIKQSNCFKKILTNPQQFIDESSKVIDRVMRTMMVDGIKYEKIAGELWEMKEFDNRELEGYLSSMYKVQDDSKTLYEYVVYDSEIEEKFAQELDSREDVKFFIKLPGWFVIDTPLGKYNPDWAVMMEKDEKVYFVAETKGTVDVTQMRVSEHQKIACGKKHFAEFDEVEFRGPIVSTKDLTT